jgi:hypothetical protein
MIGRIISVSGAALRRLGAIGFVVAIAAILSSAAPAKAATINTYSFTQSGYSSGPGIYGTLQGTFSGYVASDGLMNLAGLTAFHLEANVHYIAADFVALNVGMPTEFSFNTQGGNSSLGLVVAMQDIGVRDDTICIGSLTPFRCGAIGGANGAYLSIPFVTSEFAQVTLLSSTAVTPIPAPILLFATALSGLGLLGARARGQRRRLNAI